MRKNIYTDLACERETKTQSETPISNGIIMKKTVEVEQKKKTKRKYITFLSRPMWMLSHLDFAIFSEAIATEIRCMVDSVSPWKTTRTVLVAGLGNADMTSDSLGPQTVKGITVTRHMLPDGYEKNFQKNFCRVAAIIPGVLGNTGMETVEVLKGTVDRIHPDVIIAVDSLAAKSSERLGATVQLTDGGIDPGSGVGNHQKSITHDTLGVPVIAVGVPTVINSTALIQDILEHLNISCTDEIFNKLSDYNGFFVTPKETDLLIRSASALLADAIDRACTVGQE